MSLLALHCHDGVQLQDAGRTQVASLGLTQGGALDLTAARLANALVGNHSDVDGPCPPVLEITLGGVAFRTEAAMQLAFCGADCPLSVNGQPVSRYQTLSLARGDLMQIGYSTGGSRLYLAAAGGFLAPQVLGSCATVRREQLGGTDGRGAPVKSGDLLLTGAATGVAPIRSLPYQQHYRHRRLRTLALVSGLPLPGTIASVLAARIWQLSPDSDRMGVRLRGPALGALATTMLSEGVCLGTVQLPPNGQPLVMLNDHQTIGGYPKLGVITPQSCELLAQAQPADLVRFCFQTPEQALSAERARLTALQQQIDQLMSRY